MIKLLILPLFLSHTLMGSSSKCFLSLILISLTFLFIKSPLLSISSPCNPNSINVVSNIHILSRFRSLLDLRYSNSFGRINRHNYNAFSPSPAPSQEIRKSFHATKFHVNNTSHSPHQHPFENEKNGTKSKNNKLSTIIIVSICVSLLVIVTIITIISIILRMKSKHKNKKVIYDPGPELFYLDSLSHCIDIRDTNNCVKSTSGSFRNQIRDVSSRFLPSQFPSGDNLSCSEEETQSFHSARGSNLPELPEIHSNSSLSSPAHFSSYESVSHFCGALEKPCLSDNLDRVSHVSTKSTEGNGSNELHFQALPPPRFPFLASTNEGLPCKNTSKSHDSLKSQVPNDFLRNRKMVTLSKVASESQLSSEYQVLNDLPKMCLPAICKKENFPIPSPPPTIIPLSKDGNFHPPLLPPRITLAKNGPPVPPPLPPMKHKAYKPKPPSLMKRMEPYGEDGCSLPKLKPLHWDKVRSAPDRSMVWDQMRSSSFEFDEEKIESLFGYKLFKSVLTHEEAKSKTPSPSKNLLDHKRLQNTTILLKALNATTDLVCHALIKGNGLSVQQLEALVKMAPTKEEEENLYNYEGDIEELEPAEKFVKMVLSVPFAFAKIEMMLYKETFEDEVAHLRNSLAMLEEACKELKSSNLFLRLLEAVLKTGNRMNIGTTRGAAKAFKLDALLKLADVKGTDGKTTLLHFVIQEINKPKPEERQESRTNRALTGSDLVSGLSTELSNVKKTASIDLDVLIGSIANLSLGLSKLKRLAQNDLCVDDLNMKFVQNMSVFMQNAERVIRELKNEEQEVLSHVREITEYFHGDLSKEDANPLQIFVIVKDFLAMLDRICKELSKPKINQTGPQLVMMTR